MERQNFGAFEIYQVTRRNGMKNTKEKFDLVYASTQSLRDAKRETIHFMGRVGRRFKKLRYPIFLFTVLFVFIYNVFLYAFIALRVKDKMARALALAMTAILVLTSIDVTVYAAFQQEAPVLICEQEEHTHSEECYGEPQCVCGQEESEGHSHSEGCYTSERINVWGMEEAESHSHSDECFSEEGELICGREEAEGHTHSDSCFAEETVNICGLEEREGHVHSDSCYEKQLICGKEEHVHGENCYELDVEESEVALEKEADGALDEIIEDHPGDTEAEAVAFEQSTTIEGIEIHVSAPAGVFPANATLSVEMITSTAQVSEIENLVTDKLDEETPEDVATTVEQSYSFDIKVIDENGNEIEPDTSLGEVQVLFSNVIDESIVEDDDLAVDVFLPAW